MRKTKIYYLHRGDYVPFYIGKTNLNNKSNRIYSHKYKFGENTLMEEIDIVPIFEWKFWEKHYISLYKSWGFKLENKNNGGGGLTTIKFSEERNMKISKATQGKPKSNKGKKFSKTHKEKIKATRGFLKGRKNKWGEKYSKSLLQYDLEGNFIKEFKSIREANIELKLKNPNYNSQIGRCANGYNKTAYGYIWKFKNN